jgi:hypothetical protein
MRVSVELGYNINLQILADNNVALFAARVHVS